MRRRCRYDCEDCKYNYACDEYKVLTKYEGYKTSLCNKFKVDTILSDKYVDALIEKNRKEFHEQWIEYCYEYDDIELCEVV